MMYGYRTSDNPIFDSAPHLGFEAGGHTVNFVFWRTPAAYHDWQEKRNITRLTTTSGRAIYQSRDLHDPWELKTGLWFRDMEDYNRFLAISRRPGMLRMNADYTMHRDLSRPEERRVIPILRRRYAEFDNVRVMAITDQTFDNDGGVRCQVSFERPYVAPVLPDPQPWPEPPIPAYGWPYGSGDYGDGPYGFGEPEPPEVP